MLGKPIWLILVSVLLGAAGQVLMKYGTLRVQTVGGETVIQMIVKFFTNFPILCGMGLYALSAVTWIFALSKVQLSYAYPMVAGGYVIVAIASYYLFGDSLSMMRIIGLVAIVVGVILVAQS